MLLKQNDWNEDFAILPHGASLSLLFSQTAPTPRSTPSVFTWAETPTCCFILTEIQVRTSYILQQDDSKKQKVVKIVFLFPYTKHYESPTDTFFSPMHPTLLTRNAHQLSNIHLLNLKYLSGTRIPNVFQFLSLECLHH